MKDEIEINTCIVSFMKGHLEMLSLILTVKSVVMTILITAWADYQRAWAEMITP